MQTHEQYYTFHRAAALLHRNQTQPGFRHRGGLYSEVELLVGSGRDQTLSGQCAAAWRLQWRSVWRDPGKLPPAKEDLEPSRPFYHTHQCQ